MAVIRTLTTVAILAVSGYYLFGHHWRSILKKDYYDTVGENNGITDTPVIIVPGIYSSRLDAIIKENSELAACFGENKITIWMNLKYITEPYRKCILHALKVMKNEDIKIEVPGFGRVDTLRYLGPTKETRYMNEFVDMILKAGYKKKNLHGAPFDFRYSPGYHSANGTYFKDLTNLIVKSYNETNKKSVLICHSMGCVFSLYYLQRLSPEFKDKYIDKLMSVAGAWGGSMMSLLSITYGYNFSLNIPVTLTHMFREIAQTQPTTFLLLPNPVVYPEDQSLVTYSDISYSSSNISEFLTMMENWQGLELYKENKNAVDLNEGPGVDLYCVYSNNVPTVEKVKVPSFARMQGIPLVEFGDGDGVVNFNSLSACARWNSTTNGGHKVVTNVVPNSDHISILNDDKSQKIMNQILKQST